MLLFGNSLFTSIGSSSKTVAEKKKTPPKKDNCCKLNRGNEANVQLIKICRLEKSTVIYMKIINASDACSYTNRQVDLN